MKHIVLVIVAVLVIISCRTSKNLTTQEYKRDSVRIEYRERTVFVPDTVFFEIPRQTAERTTADSISLLENDYAVSEVHLNRDGTFSHFLNSKPQTKLIRTKRRIEYLDSIIYRDKWHDSRQSMTKYVPHKRSWWEQAQIYGFWAAIIFLAIIYRKWIYKAVIGLILRK